MSSTRAERRAAKRAELRELFERVGTVDKPRPLRWPRKTKAAR